MLLESQPDLVVAGTAHDGEAALALVDREPLDVVLMDIRMPLLDGLEATRRITGGEGAERTSGPQVIVLTTFRQEEAVFRSLRAGASAFLTKDATPEQLLATVRAVAAGDAPPVAAVAWCAASRTSTASAARRRSSRPSRRASARSTPSSRRA
ncbi:response regulator [Rathayibacter sp. VKM Ac-2630]|uniref:response regulator n=1 Tax=Rathayibacter sp. VKM Ac-2630 TaxID=1938617 RepID=UPI0031586A12